MPLDDDCTRAIERLAAEVKALREEVLGKAPDELLSTKDAAKYAGVSQRALRMMVFRGTVRAMHIGRRLRFRRADLVRVT